MTPALRISPTPTPEEAAAIGAAVATLLATSGAPAADPRPAAYRSAWRRAAIREGAGLPADDMRSR